MNDEQLALDGAKKFAAQFPGFLKACEMLGAIGSIKQAGDEAQARLDKLKADEAAMNAQIASDWAESANMVEKIKTDIASEQESATSHIANRMAEAEKAVDDAKTRAAGIVAEAQATAGKIVDDANQATAGIKNRIGELSNAINDKKAQLEALEADLAARQRVRDDINAKIAELKARL